MNNKKYILKAIEKEHQYKEFSESEQIYDIFNIDLYQYFIVLDNNFDGDELFRKLKKFLGNQSNSFEIDLESFVSLINDENLEKLLFSLINAIEYSNNFFAWTLNQKNLEKKLNHKLIGINESLISKIEQISNVAKARTFARVLQDMPSNLMNPYEFVEKVKEKFKGKKVKIKVLNKKDLIKNKMNLILSVGQASTNECDEPRLMYIEYIGNPDSNEKIGFIGKGVCFDSGGLNIKTGNHMRWMKYDMSGAAIVASTLLPIIENNLKVNAVAIMPLVTNLVGSKGLRPDDVVISYSGKTVEIDNTDAEGRLILADAISYACKDLKVTEIYNIATLTGAMIYCLGETYTGVWSTSDKIWNNIETQAELSGELVWRLPFHHDFKDLLKSKYADIANSVSDARGGSSRAAMFLKEFVIGNVEFSHFDIAGTGDAGNSGTGVMLNTFYNIAAAKNNK